MKIVVFAILAIFLVASVSGTNKRCKGLEDGTRLVHLKHCNRYVECKKGKEKTQKCGKNLYFDAETLECVTLENAQCFETTSTEKPTTTTTENTTTEPVEPTTIPDEPTTTPVETTIEPEEPTTKPGEPTTIPDEPTTKPEEPTTIPEEPTTKPEEPTTKPDEPTTKPDEPTTKPEEPTTNPGEPTTIPDEPTTKPEEPTTIPEEPTNNPGEPTTIPDEPTTKPEEPTTIPEEPTTQPEEPTTIPEEPTTKPEEPTTIPEEPTAPTEDPNITESPIGNEICKGVLSGIKKHPNNCYQYINCFQEEASVVNCPAGHIFFPRLVICVPGNQETCKPNLPAYVPTVEPIPTTQAVTTSLPATTTPTIEEQCEDLFLGVLPHPTICYKFVTCFLGKATIEDCPKNFVFFQKLTSCLPGDRDVCQIYDEDYANKVKTL